MSGARRFLSVIPTLVQPNQCSGSVSFLDASWHMPGSNRDALAEFRKERIKGSTFLDFESVKDVKNPLPHMLPTANQMGTFLNQAGLSPDHHVFVYDNAGMQSSSRGWFVLTAFSIQNVSILDGGLASWKSHRLSSLPVESGPAPKPKPSKNDWVCVFRPDLVRSLEDMKENLSTKTAQVVDARSSARFRGSQQEPRPGLRCGHIPFSLNVPWTSIIIQDQGIAKFANKDYILQTFRKAGVNVDDNSVPIILTCGSGITAAVLMAGLHLSGIPLSRLSLYDGSWAEWGDCRQELPIETCS